MTMRLAGVDAGPPKKKTRSSPAYGERLLSRSHANSLVGEQSMVIRGTRRVVMSSSGAAPKSATLCLRSLNAASSVLTTAGRRCVDCGCPDTRHSRRWDASLPGGL